MKYFSILRPLKNDIRYEYASWKNVWLCFISIVWFHFSHKIEKFRFESNWNILMFFHKKRYDVRFKYVPWKNVWFCFIYIAWVHFSHKTEKFQFWKSLKYFNNFWSKKWCQIWICPAKQCLIWFKLRCLSRISAISWEVRILKFIEIV